jgi:Glycosyltransferase family 87
VTPVRLLRITTILALAYSVAHFAWSGVRLPLDHPNLNKFYEEASPLAAHLESGAPVHSLNPAQYGPVFFFIMHPLLRAHLRETALAAWLYAIQLVAIVASFLLTCAVLKRVVGSPDARRWRFVVAWLAVIWLNFTPLYTVVALKSVETWELGLISLGLYAHVRTWRWTAAGALAAAGLIKVLPFVFLYYWLITDRPTWARACATVAALLLASHLLYGAEMGLRYLPRIATAAAGQSYGLDWHENISLKAAIAKLFGVLPAPKVDAARTSGYFVALTGWRRTAAVALGDVLAIAGVVALTWTWLRAKGTRSPEQVVREWSVLAVAVLILSPNTVYEYLTIALGAISYAFVRLVYSDRPNVAGSLSFIASLFLLGGIVPRQWLNRLTMMDALKQWTQLTHLTASEAYQYFCIPLAALVLLLVTIWRLQPPLQTCAAGSELSRASDPVRSGVS